MRWVRAASHAELAVLRSRRAAALRRTLRPGAAAGARGPAGGPNAPRPPSAEAPALMGRPPPALRRRWRHLEAPEQQQSALACYCCSICRDFKATDGVDNIIDACVIVLLSSCKR